MLNNSYFYSLFVMAFVRYRFSLINQVNMTFIYAISLINYLVSLVLHAGLTHKYTLLSCCSCVKLYHIPIAPTPKGDNCLHDNKALSHVMCCSDIFI